MAAWKDERMRDARLELANEPTIQYFLGGLLKKAKRVVKRAVDRVKKGVRTFSLRPILRKLTGLVRPLIQRVLKLALHRHRNRTRRAAA